MMRCNPHVRRWILAVLMGTASSSISLADWPSFLGSNRDGVSSETGLIETWPEGGLREVWRVPGGTGMSGISVLGDRLVTLAHQDGQQVALALDVKTGQQLWRLTLAPEYENSMGNGPRATPALGGGRAFVMTGEGIVVAINLADGEMLWRRELPEEFGGEPSEYGMAGSPLLVDDQVIVHAGGERGQIVALDAALGETVWATGSGKAAYSSPTLLEIAGQKQLVSFVAQGIVGLDPRSGEKLWEYAFPTDYDCNIAVPISLQGDVFISAGENHGATRLRLVRDADRYQVESVWESLGPRSVMRNEWQTALHWEGHLYGFDNVGSAGPVTHLTCVDAATGERRWQQVRFGKGNAIAAEGKLFMTTMDGDVVVARVSPAGYEELGRQRVLQTTRQAPSLSDGLLFVRDDEVIVCLQVGAEAN